MSNITTTTTTTKRQQNIKNSCACMCGFFHSLYSVLPEDCKCAYLKIFKCFLIIFSISYFRSINYLTAIITEHMF